MEDRAFFVVDTGVSVEAKRCTATPGQGVFCGGSRHGVPRLLSENGWRAVLCRASRRDGFSDPDHKLDIKRVGIVIGAPKDQALFEAFAILVGVRLRILLYQEVGGTLAHRLAGRTWVDIQSTSPRPARQYCRQGNLARLGAGPVRDRFPRTHSRGEQRIRGHFIEIHQQGAWRKKPDRLASAEQDVPPKKETRGGGRRPKWVTNRRTVGSARRR